MAIMYTTNPLYTKPLLPKIIFKSLNNSTVYYTYDPFADSGTSTKPIYCSVQPASPNHQGQFTVQIEDQTGAISQGVNLNTRCTIDCGKQSSQMTRLISGVVRQTGYSRGADGKRLYTLSGSSTGIRLNERITYQKQEMRFLADGFTPDTSDPGMKADALLASIISIGTYPTVEAIDTSSIVADSDVENLVPSITVEYGQLQDAVNLIEEHTGADVYVDTDDVVLLRHPAQPFIKGKGFTITNKKTTNDNADDTMYLVGKNWDYTESMLVSDNFSNEIFGILPSEPEPSNIQDAVGVGTGGTVLANGVAATATPNTLEEAVKFKPTHSHWLPGDIFVNLNLVSIPIPPVSWTTRLRICTDTGGVPTNAGGVVANIDINQADIQATNDQISTYAIINTQSFFNSSNVSIPSFDLDTTKDHWLIFSDDNIVNGTPWSQVGDYKYQIMRKHTTNMSSNSAGGSSWTTVTNNPPYSFIVAFPRRRSLAFVARDTKAISAMSGGTTRAGLIESTLSGLPSTVKTKEAMQKYMAQQLYFMARPRMNFNMGKVTAPNIPPLPGDPIMISDSVLGLSTAGKRAVMTTCGDMTYSWGGAGGGGAGYEAPTFLSIQPVGVFAGYRDPS